MGTIAMGKIEQGKACPGQQCIILPNKTITEIQSVYIEDDEYKYANPGEDVRLKLKNVDEERSKLVNNLVITVLRPVHCRIVHLVNSNNKLINTQCLRQHSMLSSLTALIKSSLH
mmetsp:Transcript_6989/g.5791  ORF Transcript_6989/g.5791 Transcript_6989/m.5791 type:complete len:115 (-) Transcript_6989:7-351(-)